MNAPSGAQAQAPATWRSEIGDVARAAAGGMLFGIPLLYTMEVWWIGSFTTPARSLVVLAVAFLLVLALNRTSGFRSTKDVRLSDAVMDSVEALAIGIVCVALVLVLIGELGSATPTGEAVGKVVYESTPFVIGIGLARHFLRRGRTRGDGDEATGDEPVPAIDTTLADVGATMLGAVFVSFNIAPTDEIPMIAARLSPPWVLALLLASVAISYVIVFEAGFSNEDQRRTQQGILQHPLTETVACYLIALVVSAVLLWFFQRVTPDEPLDFTLSQVIVLGLPAAIGGAAGRLAV